MSALVVAVGSVKGAPGSTTFALTLAAAWPVRGDEPALLVEADGSGGSLAAWCSGGGPGDPRAGLVDLAAAARHRAGTGPGAGVAAYATELACGVWAVRAPAAGPQAAAAVEVLGHSRFAVLHEDADGFGVVVVDAGRIAASGSVVPGAPDVLVLVCRGGVDAMGHVAGRIEQLQMLVPVVDLVVVGPSPYQPAEVEVAFGIGRVHMCPWDPAGVQALVEGRRGWRRARLLRAARAVAEDVCWRADTGHLVDQRTGPAPAWPQALVPPVEPGLVPGRVDDVGGVR